MYWYILVYVGLCRYHTIAWYIPVHTGTYWYELGTYHWSGFQMHGSPGLSALVVSSVTADLSESDPSRPIFGPLVRVLTRNLNLTGRLPLSELRSPSLSARRQPLASGVSPCARNS
jgi:hypothetical protein